MRKRFASGRPQLLLAIIVLSSGISGHLDAEPTTSFGPWKIGMEVAEARRAGPDLKEVGSGSFEWTTWTTKRPLEIYGEMGSVSLSFQSKKLSGIVARYGRYEDHGEFSKVASNVLSNVITLLGGERHDEMMREVKNRLGSLVGTPRGSDSFAINGHPTMQVALNGSDQYGFELTFHVSTRPETLMRKFLLEPEGSTGPTFPPVPSGPMTTKEPNEAWSLELPGSGKVPFKRQLTSINALLVRPIDGGGNAASAMLLTATAVPGLNESRIIFRFNQPIGEDMSRGATSAIRAVQLRKSYPSGSEVEFGFANKWSGKDGPSASTACAILMESLIDGFEIPKDFAVTGDLNTDGSVQPVGGIADKIRGAMESSCNVIAVPVGNLEDLDDLVVEEGLRRFLTARVFVISTLDDGLVLANPAARGKDWTAAFESVDAVQKMLASRGAAALYSTETQGKLESLEKTLPNCYTIQVLLRASRKQHPSRYSLVGTINRIDAAMEPFATAINDIKSGTNIEDYKIGRDISLQDAKNALTSLREKSDPRFLEVIDAEVSVVVEFQKLASSNLKSSTVASNQLKEFKVAVQRSETAWAKIRESKAIQDEMMKRGR
jgi:hypothetical protein